MPGFSFSRSEILRVFIEGKDIDVLARYLRLNTLGLVQEAGSGHLGSSFSVMDLLLAIHIFEQGADFPGPPNEKYRVFSSKGHDAPAFYAVNNFLGLIPDDVMKLRRLGFLPGHPELGTGGSITNTGSLGMGISKAKGFAKADKLLGRDTNTYVVLGDGELQEGQIWESMAGIKFDEYSKITAVVDLNSIQSDTWTELVRPLGNLRKRVEAVDWTYFEVDGHDFSALHESLGKASSVKGPVFLVAKTRKGAGSKTLEGFPKDGKFYHFHSGALTPNLAEKVRDEILTSLQGEAKSSFDFQKSPKMDNSSMSNHWALVLLALAESDQRIIVLDGDLQLDTGTYLAANAIGSRYVQMGIAEQDMVSTAGTLALSGFIPIVHSFSTFLTMRPHEQIFNNATEKTKIIYVGFLSGIVPSYAGFSHQAVSDMTTMSAIPGMMIFEPATLEEVKESLRLAMSHAGPSYMRMNSLSPIIAPLEVSSRSTFGSRYGFGEDFSIVCSGSFSFGVAIEVIKKLESKNIFGSVFTLPVKSTFGENQSHELDKYGERVLLIENGNLFFGSMLELYFALVRNGKSAKIHSIEGLPVNGEILEVSRFHQMDADSISKLVEELLEGAS